MQSHLCRDPDRIGEPKSVVIVGRVWEWHRAQDYWALQDLKLTFLTAQIIQQLSFWEKRLLRNMTISVSEVRKQLFRYVRDDIGKYCLQKKYWLISILVRFEEISFTEYGSIWVDVIEVDL